MRLTFILVSVFLSSWQTYAQTHMKADSLHSKFRTDQTDDVYQFRFKKLAVPVTLVGFGFMSLGTDALKNLNSSTFNEITEHDPAHIKFDNYTQYLSAAAVYGLNLAGVEGKHNFRDRTIILVTSQLISAAFVLPLKTITKEERPDKSNFLSFPSGHTTNAFSTAYFLYYEYKDHNIWMALSGFPVAAFTGIYRMLNDKHWFGDVIAGMGFGILSTKMAYWLFPTLSNFLNISESSRIQVMVMPVYSQNKMGVGLSLNF